jgi:nicotinic acid phosphoribosyltransferase
MSKHTPGPWKQTSESNVPAGNTKVARVCDGQAICWTTITNGRFDEAEANAELIARAPELLEQKAVLVEALREILTFIRSCHESADEMEWLAVQVHKMAYAALAKQNQLPEQLAKAQDD